MLKNLLNLAATAAWIWLFAKSCMAVGRRQERREQKLRSHD